MKTMLDKCAVAGDITQAIDRRGAWSCAVTVIGGTENTAVKLQSADSADGEFTDFKTLISADEAEADQYKGFVLDLSGAGNFIKIVGATMATCVLGDCDYDVKKVAIKAGEIPSGADLEDNKTATIDVSTYTEPVEIEPTAGKDGMKKATVILTNIPSSSGGEKVRYFDGRDTHYAANPRGFWVIGKNQTSGKACCLVLGASTDMSVHGQSFCIQTIQSVTDNSLMIDEYGRESFAEVTADVVAQAIANLN